VDLPEGIESKPIWLVYTVKGDPGDRAYFRSPVLREIGGRWFLVGPQLQFDCEPDRWWVNRTAMLAWDSVKAVMLFDEEEFTRLANEARQRPPN